MVRSLNAKIIGKTSYRTNLESCVAVREGEQSEVELLPSSVCSLLGVSVGNPTFQSWGVDSNADWEPPTVKQRR